MHTIEGALPRAVPNHTIPVYTPFLAAKRNVMFCNPYFHNEKGKQYLIDRS